MRGVCLTILLLLAEVSLSAAEGVDFFEKKIRPVLVNHCYKCHSAKAEAKGKLKGGLRLDLRDAIRAKGDSGKNAVVPGDPQKSQLLNAISYLDAELQMPPKNRLPQSVVSDFRIWIEMGAPDPRDGKSNLKEEATIDFEQARQFWSFKPVKKPPLPSVNDESWVKNPLDRFILAKIEKVGLAPAPAGDRRMLIRRATYDLTGLPPTVEEIKDFLSDKSPNAFAKVINRLLASPCYGEKWGRHWLDVARYADSNGLDENLVYINAFRYRNWVIDAFNSDLPYDQFVQQQIAGDLLPAAKGESLSKQHARAVATGFFCVGPKMLAEDDSRKMQMDIIDEQIDTLGRAFMGMTIGCARCHDHKFDPIPTRDYYALAGIFKSTKTMENHKVVAVWHEREINTPKQQKQLDENSRKQKAKQQAIDRLIQEGAAKAQKEGRKRAADYLIAAVLDLIHQNLVDQVAENKVDGARVIEAEKYTRGTKAVAELTGYGEGIGILGSHGPARAEYDISLEEAGAYMLRVRYAAEDARPSKLFLNGMLLKQDFAGKQTGTWYPDSQTYFSEGIYIFRSGKNTLILDCSTPFPHIDKLMLVPIDRTRSLVKLLPTDAGDLRDQYKRQWAAYLKKVASDPKSPFFEWHNILKDSSAAKAKNLIEKFRKQFSEATQGSELYQILNDPKGPFAASAKPEQLLGKNETAKLGELRAALKKLEADKPKVAKAMAITEGKPENLKVHVRGNYLHLGENTPRGFLRVTNIDSTKIPEKSSGRLELARWMTESKHPLTARVMANRIWLWHFGDGLVRSPDNFGKLGQPPTHPELLDWLASFFVENGWSINKMHQMIMLSATYQMSSQFDAKAAAIDPENKFWWRFNRRRLLAEEIRDSVLEIDGTLEHGVQQQLMTYKPREYVTGSGKKNASFDFKCRSVYVPVIRSSLYPVMTAFDFGDPSVTQGQRSSTTVAPQALFMMNDKMVHDASQRLAKTANKEKDLPSAITHLYQAVLKRGPTEMEQRNARAFISKLHDQVPSESDKRDQQALEGLARVLIASNEFIFVD